MSSNSMLGRGTPGTASLADNPNSYQVGGSHYSRSDYQHWDYATDLAMCHLEGAATKYLARAGNKEGEPREKDLQKSVHYLEKLVSVFKEGRLAPLTIRQARRPGDVGAVEGLTARFIATSMYGAAFTPRAVAALVGLSRWHDGGELVAVLELVKAEYEEERSLPKKKVGDPLRT